MGWGGGEAKLNLYTFKSKFNCWKNISSVFQHMVEQWLKMNLRFNDLMINLKKDEVNAAHCLTKESWLNDEKRLHNYVKYISMGIWKKN